MQFAHLSSLAKKTAAKRRSRNFHSMKIFQPRVGVADDWSNKATLSRRAACETGSLVPRFEPMRAGQSFDRCALGDADAFAPSPDSDAVKMRACSGPKTLSATATTELALCLWPTQAASPTRSYNWSSSDTSTLTRPAVTRGHPPTAGSRVSGIRTRLLPGRTARLSYAGHAHWAGRVTAALPTVSAWGRR
jgi:hypothetical protein